MFRFANSNYLYLLFIIPVLIVLYVVLKIYHKRSLLKFAENEFLNTLMPLRSEGRRNLKFQITRCKTERN